MTEESSRRLTINGLPARLRLVVLSLGSRHGDELQPEMVDRVLDWLKPGLAQVASNDFPRVRVWPPFYSAGGFDIAFANQVPIPAPKGQRSPWVLVSGQVKMGQTIVNVGLALYADEDNTLRNLQIKSEKWQGVIGILEVKQRQPS